MSPVGGVRSSSPAPNRILEMIPGSSERTLVTIDHAWPTCGQSVETETPVWQTPVPPTMLGTLSSSTSCSDPSHQHKLSSRTTMTMQKCPLTWSNGGGCVSYFWVASRIVGARMPEPNLGAQAAVTSHLFRGSTAAHVCREPHQNTHNEYRAPKRLPTNTNGRSSCAPATTPETQTGFNCQQP